MSALEGSVSAPIGGRRIERKTLLLAAGIPLAIAAVIALLYFTQPKFRNAIRSALKLGGGVVSTAPSVTFTLSPEEVRPNTAFTIQGQFQDANGQPVTVKQGYYYVFQVDSQGKKQGLVTQGSLGANIAQFNVLVPTTKWQDQAKFDVLVSDQAISAQQLSAMIQPSGAGALETQAAGGTGYNPITGSSILVQSVSQV